jgi:multiple sugar transport system permease protein
MDNDPASVVGASPSGIAWQPAAVGLRRLDRRSDGWNSALLLSPAGLLLAALFLAPVAYSVYLGLTNLQLIGPRSVNYHFTGMANLRMLFRDREFYRSIYLTLYFVVGSGAIGSTLVGLMLALLMQDAQPALKAAVGGAVVLGTVLPPTTVAVIWQAVTASGGVLPTLFGMGSGDLLYNAPMLVVSVANGWSLCGLSMLIFAAALRNVPPDMIEAAKLEQAGPLTRFRRITLPVLRPTVITSSLLMTLLSFGNFTLVFLMTGGGPAGATNILPVYSYMQGFAFHRLSYGALLGNVIILMAAGLGMLFMGLAHLSGSADRRGGSRA